MLPPVAPGCQCTNLHRTGQQKTRSPCERAGFWSLLDFLKLVIGGGGGDRTPVRKPSTGSSTYLVVSFDLTHQTLTDKLLICDPLDFGADPRGGSQPYLCCQ